MSNRLIGILIILGFLGFITVFYLYFFVYYTGTLNIVSNVDKYRVEMYSKNLLKTFSFDCNNKICNLGDLSPINYDLKIYKDGYVNYSKNIYILKSKTIKLDIKLEKEIILEQNKDKIFINTKISENDKIINIKNSKLYYASFYLEGFGNFYFKKGENLELFLEDKKIGDFDVVDKNLINLSNIYNNLANYNNKFFYLELGDKKFLYNIDNFDYKEIDLKLEVKYIKSIENNFFIITDKGTFVYNYLTGKQDFFSLFYDFIFYKNGYISIIKKDDKIRINNLGLDLNNKDKIIYFNTETKEKKLLYESELNLEKIINVKDKVIFIDKDNNEFSLNLLDI